MHTHTKRALERVKEFRTSLGAPQHNHVALPGTVPLSVLDSPGAPQRNHAGLQGAVRLSVLASLVLPGLSSRAAGMATRSRAPPLSKPA